MRLILAVLLMVVMGCSSGMDQSNDRFIVTYSQDINGRALSWLAIICDTQTDQEYLYVNAFKAGGLTSLGSSCQPYVQLMSR